MRFTLLHDSLSRQEVSGGLGVKLVRRIPADQPGSINAEGLALAITNTRVLVGVSAGAAGIAEYFVTSEPPLTVIREMIDSLHIVSRVRM